MPRSIFDRLGIEKLSPTRIYLQLADRSIRYPEGILLNVPVKIENMWIPGDFVVMDMKEDDKIPIILGRLFLATCGAIIDVEKGKISLRVGNKKVEFKTKQPCIIGDKNVESYELASSNEIDNSKDEEREIYQACLKPIQPKPYPDTTKIAHPTPGGRQSQNVVRNKELKMVYDEKGRLIPKEIITEWIQGKGYRRVVYYQEQDPPDEMLGVAHSRRNQLYETFKHVGSS